MRFREAGECSLSRLPVIEPFVAIGTLSTLIIGVAAIIVFHLGQFAPLLPFTVTVALVRSWDPHAGFGFDFLFLILKRGIFIFYDLISSAAKYIVSQHVT